MSNQAHQPDSWQTVTHTKQLKIKGQGKENTADGTSRENLPIALVVPKAGRETQKSTTPFGSTKQDAGSIPCRFFAQGHCAAGTACTFSHSNSSDPLLCKFYSSGSCKFGTKCALSHASPSDDSTPTEVTRISRPRPGLNSEESQERDMLPADLLEHLNLDDPKPALPFGSISFAKSAQLGIESGSHTNLLIPDRSNTDRSSRPAESGTFTPTPVSVFPVMAKSDELCAFAMVGKCRFGQLCRSVHGLQCPRCLRYCLHPHDIEKNEEHIEECLGKDECSSSTLMYEVECEICMEKIALKEDPRFGLLNCDHAFCLSCIRTWRGKHNMSDLATKSCPLCRTVTYFIIPSSTWTTDQVEKQKIIDLYKKKLGYYRFSRHFNLFREIDCKHFNYGDEVCPFGGSCFYAHRHRCGIYKESPPLRSYIDKNEQHKVIRETRLCDFIDFKFKKESK